jgi:hypothetical protein
MKVKFLIASCSMVFTLAAAGSAWADEPPKNTCPRDFPASSKEDCDKAKGFFTVKDGVKICIVKDKEEKEASVHPGCKKDDGKFTAVSEVFKKTIFIKKKDDKTGDIVCKKKTEEDKKLVACLNPQGKEIGSLEPCICPDDKDDKDHRGDRDDKDHRGDKDDKDDKDRRDDKVAY